MFNVVFDTFDTSTPCTLSWCKISLMLRDLSSLLFSCAALRIFVSIAVYFPRVFLRLSYKPLRPFCLCCAIHLRSVRSFTLHNCPSGVVWLFDKMPHRIIALSARLYLPHTNGAITPNLNSANSRRLSSSSSITCDPPSLGYNIASLKSLTRSVVQRFVLLARSSIPRLINLCISPLLAKNMLSAFPFFLARRQLVNLPLPVRRLACPTLPASLSDARIALL